jgi:hemolysin III
VSAPPDVLRPRLRGALHAAAFPVALAAGAALVAAADGARARGGALVYAIGLAGLLGTSALYHRGRWSARAARWVRRADHTMIFAFIAASCTPFALLVLEPALGVPLLVVTWGAAGAGVVVTLAWPGAPRWVRSATYLAVGGVALASAPAVAAAGGAVLALVLAGSALYAAGAVVYALGRPDPRPRTFGFHEVFHALVVAGAALHFAAVRSVVS